MPGMFGRKETPGAGPPSPPSPVGAVYTVDDRDRVIELRDLPPSATGAPLPILLADEHRILLAYIVQGAPAPAEGWKEPVARKDSTDERWGIVDFETPYAHFWGPPNDESFLGHPLYARGLRHYGAFEVRDSSWIRAMERMNRVHPGHSPGMFLARRHFIFAFQDSTFECVAFGYKATMVESTRPELIANLEAKLNSKAA